MKEIKEKIISLLAEDELNKRFLTEQIEKLSTPPFDKNFYSGLLELFIHLTVEEAEAKVHWEKIFENHEYLKTKLEREVGIRVAIVDYFVNAKQMLNSPILVEIRVFKETEKLAMMDGLTGIFNRRYFEVNLKKELRRASRYDKDLALLMFDIDNFKKLNDTKGHLFGDAILKKLASLFMEISREEDIICRYGGEEFVIILPETTADGALKYAERIRANLKETQPFNENNITLSGGIAAYPYGGRSLNELIETADKALYESKFSGKDCTIIGIRDNRRGKRHKRTWKVSCRPLDSSTEGKQLQTYTQNVSFGGMRIELEYGYPLDTKLLLEMELPNGRITIVGRIVWAKKEIKNIYSYGIQFCDLKSEQLKKMAQLLPSDYYNPERRTVSQ